MKKSLQHLFSVFALALFIFIAFGSTDSNNSPSNSTSESSDQTANNLSKEELAKIALEDSLRQIRLDSIEKAKAERLAYLNRPWKTNTFVDNFGDPTNEKYIETEVEGLFSNSATRNSYLFVEVLLKKNAAGIFLHEYEKSRPAEKFIGSAQIQMKNSYGNTLIINTSKVWNQQGGILIENWASIEQYDFSRFRNFIQKSVGKIKVVIFDDYSSVYQFEIDATGFTKEFESL